MPNNTKVKTFSRLNLLQNVDLGQPAIADVDRYITSTALIDGSVGARDYSLATAYPDVPRNVTMTITSSTISAGTFEVIGLAIDGTQIREKIILSSSVKSLTGTKIFKKITNIIVAVTGEDPADRIVVGMGSVIGLPTDIVNTDAVKLVIFAKAVEASPTLSAGRFKSGVDVSGSTYDGSKQLRVWYNMSE